MELTPTIVQQGDNYILIVDDPRTGRFGIVDFCLSLEEALSRAEHHLYLYNRPINEGAFHLPDFMRLFSAERKSVGSSKRTNIYLSDQAWEYLQAQTLKYGYDGRSQTTGYTHYVSALLRANPGVASDWHDTRPEDCTMFDSDRLDAGKFPYWNKNNMFDVTENRFPRTTNLHILDLIPQLYALAVEWGITPPRGGDVLAERIRATACLEAIGLQYLTARNMPQTNPHPINFARSRRQSSGLKLGVQNLGY